MKKRKFRGFSLILSATLLMAGFLLGSLFASLRQVSVPDFAKRKILKKIFYEQKEGRVKVTRVIDGDTIEIEGGKLVRYLGIDAPEPNEAWGERAKEFNQELILDKEVRLEFDGEREDGLGRILAYVWVDKNGEIVMVNKALLDEGYAQTLFYHGRKIKYQQDFLDSEKWAKEHHYGIWLKKWIREVEGK